MPATALSGNTRHAYLRATTAPTLPVTIDATHNQFGFNSLQYIIPSGVYATVQSLADAVQAAVADEDNVTTPLFATVVAVTVSHSDPTKLLFTSVSAGVNAQTFVSGIENDALALLIVSNATALAGGDPVD